MLTHSILSTVLLYLLGIVISYLLFIPNYRSWVLMIFLFFHFFPRKIQGLYIGSFWGLLRWNEMFFTVRSLATRWVILKEWTRYCQIICIPFLILRPQLFLIIYSALLLLNVQWLFYILVIFILFIKARNSCHWAWNRIIWNIMYWLSIRLPFCWLLLLAWGRYSSSFHEKSLRLSLNYRFSDLI